MYQRRRRKITLSGNLFSQEVFNVVSKVSFVLTTGGRRGTIAAGKVMQLHKAFRGKQRTGTAPAEQRERRVMYVCLYSHVILSHMKQGMRCMCEPHTHAKAVEIKQVP